MGGIELHVKSKEDDLLDRARTGSVEALSELLADLGPEVRRIVAADFPSRLQSVLSMDDVMQQTYADAFLGIERFVPRGDGAFRAWLIRLAKRNLVDAIRMESAEKRGGSRQQIAIRTPDASFAALYEIISRTMSSPSRKVASNEAKIALEDALAKLPEHYAQVIRLYDLEGQSIEDVAKAICRSVGATYMLRSRAHDWMGELMGSASRFFTAGS